MTVGFGNILHSKAAQQLLAVVEKKPFAIASFEGVAKGSEKKGTTKDTKSTKKSFSFPL